MALIIIGFIIFLVGMAISKSQDNFRKFGNPVRVTGLILLLIGVLSPAPS